MMEDYHKKVNQLSADIHKKKQESRLFKERA